MVDRKSNAAKAPFRLGHKSERQVPPLTPVLGFNPSMDADAGRAHLMGGDRLPRLALFDAYIGLAGGIGRRKAETAESRARQLNGTATGGQGEKTDEGSRSGDSNHADSVTNKRGQTLRTDSDCNFTRPL